MDLYVIYCVQCSRFIKGFRVLRLVKVCASFGEVYMCGRTHTHTHVVMNVAPFVASCIRGRFCYDHFCKFSFICFYGRIIDANAPRRTKHSNTNSATIILRYSDCKNPVEFRSWCSTCHRRHRTSLLLFIGLRFISTCFSVGFLCCCCFSLSWTLPVICTFFVFFSFCIFTKIKITIVERRLYGKKVCILCCALQHRVAICYKLEFHFSTIDYVW